MGTHVGTCGIMWEHVGSSSTHIYTHIHTWIHMDIHENKNEIKDYLTCNDKWIYWKFVRVNIYRLKM